jgi:hypothetical protein
METPEVITALLEKRSQITGAIAELERQVRKHKHDMAQLDAAIKLFSPSVILAKREATRFARSAHFVVGELTRRCMTALREADGQPVTADAVALQAMREKGLDMGDGALRRKRCSEALLQWPSWKCLIRLRRRASSYPYV